MKKDGHYKENISDLSGMQKTSSFSHFIINNFIFFSRVPPLGGFFAKFYVFMAVLEQEMHVLAIIGLLQSHVSILLFKNY